MLTNSSPNQTTLQQPPFSPAEIKKIVSRLKKILPETWINQWDFDSARIEKPTTNYFAPVPEISKVVYQQFLYIPGLGKTPPIAVFSDGAFNDNCSDQALACAMSKTIVIPRSLFSAEGPGNARPRLLKTHITRVAGDVTELYSNDEALRGIFEHELAHIQKKAGEFHAFKAQYESYYSRGIIRQMVDDIEIVTMILKSKGYTHLTIPEVLLAAGKGKFPSWSGSVLPGGERYDEIIATRPERLFPVEPWDDSVTVSGVDSLRKRYLSIPPSEFAKESGLEQLFERASRNIVENILQSSASSASAATSSDSSSRTRDSVRLEKKMRDNLIAKFQNEYQNFMRQNDLRRAPKDTTQTIESR